MPSPQQARLGTLPSLSFSPISSTNLLGAMKELNSFATLSLPKCHYHNVPRRPTVSTGSLLIVFFMGSWRQASADIHQALSLQLSSSARQTNTFAEHYSEVIAALLSLSLCVSVFVELNPAPVRSRSSAKLGSSVQTTDANLRTLEVVINKV